MAELAADFTVEDAENCTPNLLLLVGARSNALDTTSGGNCLPRSYPILLPEFRCYCDCLSHLRHLRSPFDLPSGRPESSDEARNVPHLKVMTIAPFSCPGPNRWFA